MLITDDRIKYTAYTAVGCQICAVLWQLVVVFIVCIGKMNNDRWLVGPIESVISD